MESVGGQFAGGAPIVPVPASRDRRSSVRQRVHTPAYASLQGAGDNAILDLCEILDISERGALLQTPKGWELGSALDLLLDFSETQTKVRAKGEVVWADAGGRVGVRFPDLNEEARRKLQEWLFLNVMVAAANHSVGIVPPPVVLPPVAPDLPPSTPPQVAADAASLPILPEPAERPQALEPALEISDDNILEAEPGTLAGADYTTTLSVLAAVQREVEGLGADSEAAFQLVAERARALTCAEGCAVAVEEGAAMVSRGSSGSAPPVGVPVDRNAGISGRCVKTGLLQRCDDAERDTRVDRESCRELGIQSILAVPVRLGERVTGVVEVFSSRTHAFGDFDATILQRLAETVQAVGNRRSRPEAPRAPEQLSSGDLAPELNLPIFATMADTSAEENMGFLRRYLMVLVSVAVLVLAVLAYMLAPWISEHMRADPAAAAPVTMTSPATSEPSPAPPPTIEQIRERALQGDAYAQFALGTRYATGEDEPQDYDIAGRWFLKAAEQGMVLAQDTLGAYYWAGRGVPKDVVKAYYWSSVARLGGNQASQVRVQFLNPQLTQEQAAAIQRQAAEFFHKHPPLSSDNPR
jgi:hypothetical protein